MKEQTEKDAKKKVIKTEPKELEKGHQRLYD